MSSAGQGGAGGSGNGNALDQLEQQLERSIENVRQIRIIVSDFQPQGQTGLNQVRYLSTMLLIQTVYLPSIIYPFTEATADRQGPQRNRLPST
jgi:hypothetical protein